MIALALGCDLFVVALECDICCRVFCGKYFVVGNATTANCELYCWHENYISSNELFLFRRDMHDI